MGESIPAGHEATRYIQQACRSGKTASVAVRMDGEWRLCRSRLLGCNLNRGILWAEHPLPLWKSQPVALADKQQLGFRFPCDDRRVTFMGTVEKIRSLNRGSTQQAAIEVSVPDDVVCENLRRSFRVRIDPEFS